MSKHTTPPHPIRQQQKNSGKQSKDSRHGRQHDSEEPTTRLTIDKDMAKVIENAVCGINMKVVLGSFFGAIAPPSKWFTK